MESLPRYLGRLAVILVAALAALGVHASIAGATTFSVSPTRIELRPGTTSAVLTVVNTGRTPARFQVSAFSWDQSVEGVMQLADTQSIVCYPPLVEILPGESRRIRVGSTAGVASTERAFRVFVEELPDNVSDDSGLGVHVRARMGIPVFVRGTQASAAVSIDDIATATGTVSFALHNLGGIHVMPLTVTVRALSLSGAPLFEEQVPAWYLLAQHSLELSAAVDPHRCAGTAQVQIEARFEGGLATARTIPVAGQFCPGVR